MKHRAQRTIAGLFLACCSFGAALLLAAPQRASAQHPSFHDSLNVDDIRFEGDTLDDAGDLFPLLETQESPGSVATFLWSISERLPFAAEPRFFDYDLLQLDAETLARYLKSNGWISAAVKGSYSRVEGEQSVVAIFTIASGPRSYIDSVDHRNLIGLPAELDSVIRVGKDRLLIPGRPFSEENVQGEIARVTQLMANNGYPVFSCDSVTVERLKSDNNVLIRLWHSHGRRLRVGAITRTVKSTEELNLASQIIEDRLEVKRGDIYSNEKRERSETNLNRLGIFTGVQINATFPSMRDTTRNEVPLDVLLTPKERHELAPGLLVNNMLGRLNAGAEITYLFRNVFGGAQTLTARVNFLSKVNLPIDAYQGILQLRLDQPYLIDNDNSGFVSIAYIRAYESDLYGGDILQSVLGVRRLFTARLQGNAEWTLEQSKYNILARGQSLVNTPFAAFDTTGIDYRNSIITLSAERDLTNDFYNPSAGMYLKAAFEEAGLLKQLLPSLFSSFQSAEYRKLEASLRFFHDVSRNSTSIVGLKLKAGAIFRYGQSKDENIPVPFNRRYYAGGSQSVRGWNSRTLAAGGPDQASFGGNALVEASTEYRWQILPHSKPWFFVEPAAIWLVVFADAGNLWPEPGSIRASEIAGAFGFGIRYNLFFGPIRLDYGMKAYDPRAAGPHWFTGRRFFTEVFQKGIIALGIGHAF